MARAAEHAKFNFWAVMATCAVVRYQDGKPVDGVPVVMGAAAALLPSLPDLLEPAIHPNHRRFFHSWTAVMALSYGMHRLYKWEAKDDSQKLWRVLGLVAGSAYLAHLVRDAFTSKSLPVV